MNTIRHGLVAMLLLTLATAPVLAIGLGDPAPPLKIKEWVKGKPVDLKAGKGKNIYVVEFWATWCGPCIRGMPHLSELQKKFADQGVVIIGVTAKDRSQDLPDVKTFVEKMGDKMAYTVAFDDGRATNEAYMDAFKKSGIPQAFVIDKEGKIVWEGHPMMGLEAVLEKILTGKYDVKSLAEVGKKAQETTVKRAVIKEELSKKYFELVTSSKDAKDENKLGEQVLKALDGDAVGLNEFAWKILDDQSVLMRDLELAMRAAKAAYDACEGKDAAIVDTYARALWETGKREEAIKYQKKAVELAPNEQIKAELERTLKDYEQKLGGKK